MSFGRALARGPLGSLARRAPRHARRAGRTRRRLSSGRARPLLSSRLARRLLLAAVVVGGLLLGGWLWLRDSSLVAVTKVTVRGVSGPDAGAIRSALVGAARGMTTLDVSMSQLRTAVSSYPVVADLQASTQFPHGMRIRVIERPPVAMVSVAGRNLAVAGDGMLLHDLVVSSPLPVVPLTVPPGGPRLTGPALQAAKLLGAAPAQLIPKVAQVSAVAGHGLAAQIRGGPSVYFGDSSNARAKWLAASAVLADAGSAGATYIDVTDPVRPAAGAGGSSATGTTTTSSGGGSTTATGTTTSSGGGSATNSGGAPGG
jgi:cell division protein FtsQ